jgi:hypothetical protein
MALDKAIQSILESRKVHHGLELCAYQSLYNSLSESDQKTLDDAWAKNYPVNLLVQALRADGHKCSADTMRTHRNGTCRCPKE